jgi:predicted Zn-dependent peptidase
MKYNYVRHPSRLVTLMATYGGGSRVEGTKYPQGIAHFMEHVRFKGTDKYTAQELLKKVAYYGGSWNAFTSQDLVNFYIKIPVENVEKGFEYLSEIIWNPTFPQKELDKEKEVVCQEVRMYEDDVHDLTYYSILGNVFNNALKNKIVGTEESVRSITREHLLEFNKEVYDRDNMLITLVGPEDEAALVCKYFETPDGKLNFKPAEKTVDYAPSFLKEFDKAGHIQNTVMIAFGSQELHSTIKEDLPVARVFNSIFGGNDDSRLFLNVRENMGLVYGIGSDVDDMFDGTLFMINTLTEPENTNKVLEVVDNEIGKMLEAPPTDEEFNRAKNRIKSYIYASLESSYGNAMRSILQEFAGYDNIDTFLEKVNAVTKEQVHDFAKKVFSANKYVSVCKGVGEKL